MHASRTLYILGDTMFVSMQRDVSWLVCFTVSDTDEKKQLEEPEADRRGESSLNSWLASATRIWPETNECWQWAARNIVSIGENVRWSDDRYAWTLWHVLSSRSVDGRGTAYHILEASVLADKSGLVLNVISRWWW